MATHIGPQTEAPIQSVVSIWSEISSGSPDVAELWASGVDVLSFVGVATVGAPGEAQTARRTLPLLAPGELDTAVETCEKIIAHGQSQQLRGDDGGGGRRRPGGGGQGGGGGGRIPPELLTLIMQAVAMFRELLKGRQGTPTPPTA